MKKLKFWGIFAAFVAVLWLFIPADETESPYKKQNIIEPPQAQYVDPVQDLIDSGSIPALNKLKSAEAKKRDLLLASARSSQEPAPMQFPTQQVKISTKRGLLPLQLGIAETKQQQEQGMMYYRQWPANAMHGLLFVFKDPAVLTMWMKNTYIPLDIVFMDEGGIILNIYEQAKPLRQDTIASEGMAQYVLELPAGAARKWQITVGDRLIYSPQK